MSAVPKLSIVQRGGFPGAGVSRDTIKDALQDSASESNLDKNNLDGQGPISLRYGTLETARQDALDEARKMSAAVIPYLYPPESVDIFNTEASEQGLVAKGIINLSAELSGTIFPANAKFFEHTVKPDLLREVEALKEQAEAEGINTASSVEVASTVTQLNAKLISRDQILREIIKESPDAENFYQAILYAIVGGTAVFFKPNLSTSKIYTLEDFVCEFDTTQELVDVIVRDVIHPSKFAPEDLHSLFGTSDLQKFEDAEINAIPVYTRQVRRHEHWEIQVEVAGKRFKKMEGKEDLDSPPFIVIPFFLLPKQSYGISWCTHLKGDINQFENMALSINELIKAACKIIGYLPPEAKMTQNEITNRPGLSWIFSTGGDKPEMMLADISKNLNIVFQVFQSLQQQLMAAFLLSEAVRRDAERVPSVEVTAVLQGLRKILGGLHLSLARRWQYPYTRRVTRLAEQAGEVTELSKLDDVRLMLTAGVETLEAAEDMQAMGEWLGFVGSHPEGMQRVNINELGGRIGNYKKIDVENLLFTDEQYQEKMGINQLVNIVQQMGPQGPGMAAMAINAMMQDPQGFAEAFQQGRGSGVAGGVDNSQEAG